MISAYDKPVAPQKSDLQPKQEPQKPKDPPKVTNSVALNSLTKPEPVKAVVN